MELNKLIIKNIKKSLILGILLSVISFLILTYFKAYKIETTLYVNDKYLKEMSEDAKYILKSINYLDYLKDNSKNITKIFDKTDEYSLTKRLLVEKPSQDSTIKLTFVSKDKDLGVEFSKEYSLIANSFIKQWKNKYFDEMVKNLENQYNMLKQNTDIINYRDALADSTIFKLVYYKQIRDDKSDIVRITNYKIKSKYNKKLITGAVFILGFILPIGYDVFKKK